MKLLILSVLVGLAVAQHHHCTSTDDCHRLGFLCHALHEDVACNHGQCQCEPRTLRARQAHPPNHHGPTCAHHLECHRHCAATETAECKDGHCVCTPSGTGSTSNCTTSTDCDSIKDTCTILQEEVACNSGRCQCVPKTLRKRQHHPPNHHPDQHHCGGHSDCHNIDNLCNALSEDAECQNGQCVCVPRTLRARQAHHPPNNHHGPTCAHHHECHQHCAITETAECTDGHCVCTPSATVSTSSCTVSADCGSIKDTCTILQEEVACNSGRCQCVPKTLRKRQHHPPNHHPDQHHCGGHSDCHNIDNLCNALSEDAECQNGQCVCVPRK